MANIFLCKKILDMNERGLLYDTGFLGSLHVRIGDTLLQNLEIGVTLFGWNQKLGCPML